ncbi:hypothetical protein QE357_004736 [Siphonobacter sp. BAB-5404]|nr:hypothetical protein [Siphonobacter sp. SORGH_AS_0500]
MYASLVDKCTDFHLFIFAFDDHCYDVLQRLHLTHATIISLKEFENEALLAVKKDRTAGEYCWTCTSSTLWYCIHTYSLDHCTYIDADLLFFSDPKVLTDEMGENSVLITEHRYSPEHDQSALSGIYCVQFITFKNTAEGLAVLDWWRKACLEWCYHRFEDGKFGDQKYLDDWTTRFTGVHVLQHLGGGVAPWNNTQYTFRKKGDEVFVQKDSQVQALVFYHFHDFRYCLNQVFRLTDEQYTLSKEAISLIYKPYAQALAQAETQIKQADQNSMFHEPLYSLSWVQSNLGRQANFLIKGSYKNYYRQTKFY